MTLGPAALLACILILSDGLFTGSVSAGENHDSPPTNPRHPNRYDFMWRTPPLPHYIVAMSRDDPLCDSITRAFNEPTTSKGAPPGSLYKNRIFVKWRQYPLHHGGEGGDVDVAAADPFNEGDKSPIARVRLSDVRGPWYELCVFPGGHDLAAQSWKSAEDVIHDPKCTKIWDRELYHLTFKDSLARPTFSPEDLNRLYPEARNRSDFRWPARESDRPEINLASKNGIQFFVLRNTVSEVTLVTQFKGRTDPPGNICLIGPEVPIETPLVPKQHPPAKKPME